MQDKGMRFKASYSGFVIPETGELFVATPEKFNFETTIDSIRAFLKAKPIPEGKRYALSSPGSGRNCSGIV